MERIDLNVVFVVREQTRLGFIAKPNLHSSHDRCKK